ncbi:MAG: hypothetical protein GWN61_15110, partial [candidate division Zixibacteria bacterium]|nr:hypothetical protein [candidate division KSB1 bacterium]NIR65567.1 hypothetical protein [candidate division Zixibacteria bacterium]NIS47256.1 hypothetical protein [candidate division Zixibacteria bacterium]NIV07462.1 hypothetical protein [candidate division Zixibacteria bacterium]NIW70985.1 hypothetical protein [candidate division KSB1 bacterium]
ELKKYLHRSTPEEFEKLERATRGMLKKLLHQPISQLRRYGNGYPGGEERINVLWEMFNLKNSATKWEDSHEE